MRAPAARLAIPPPTQDGRQTGLLILLRTIRLQRKTLCGFAEYLRGIANSNAFLAAFHILVNIYVSKFKAFARAE
jgi:hypothetical protein